RCNYERDSRAISPVRETLPPFPETTTIPPYQIARSLLNLHNAAGLLDPTRALPRAPTLAQQPHFLPRHSNSVSISKTRRVQPARSPKTPPQKPQISPETAHAKSLRSSRPPAKLQRQFSCENGKPPKRTLQIQKSTNLRSPRRGDSKTGAAPMH